jgi:hypothetical protein
MYLTYSTSAQSGTRTSSVNAALASAARFGYTNDQQNSFVTVNIPPTAGTYAGKSDYVEVIVQSNLKGSFGAAITQQKLVVAGRSVAKGRPMAVGIFATSPNAVGALTISGNIEADVRNASVRVNSNSVLGLLSLNNSRAVTDALQVVGGVSLLGLTLNVAVQTGVDPIPDPLLALDAPDQSNMTVQRTSALSYSAAASHTLSPGIYRGGIALGGSSVTTLQPGIYVVQGGLSVSGNAQLSGNGVLIYNTYTAANPAGSLNFAGTGAINLSAPTSGPYQGIVFFQDRNQDAAVTLQANASTQIGGVFYAPIATVNVVGNGSTTSNIVAGGVLANKISVSGNGGITIDGGTNLPQIPQINLVE